MTRAHLLWGAALAVGLVLAVLVSGLAPAGTGTAGSSSAAAPAPAHTRLYGPTPFPATGTYSATKTALESTAYAIAIREGYSASEAHADAVAWAKATPAAIHAAGSCVGPVCIPWNLPPWEVGAAAAGGGCVGGVLVTAGLSLASTVTIIGPPIVSGIACAAGAAATYIGLTAGYNVGRSGLPSTLTQATLWAQTLASGIYAAANLTGSSYATLQSSLNFSAVAFQRMADHAAVYQIGNASFDLGLDEAQSGIASQFGALLTSYDIQNSRILLPLLQAFEAQGAPGSIYASSLLAASIPGGADWQAQSDTAFSVAYAGPTIGSSGGIDGNFWIPSGSNLTFFCSGSEVIFKSLVGPSSRFYNFTGTQNTVRFNWTDGVWNVTSTGNCQMTYPYGARLVYSTGHGGDLIAGSSVRYATLLTRGANAKVGCGSTVGTQQLQVGSGSVWQLYTETGGSGGSCGSAVAITPVAPLFAYGIGVSIESYYGDAMLQAALNAEAYWSFLRSIGYTSASQIPANCIVPAPYQAMPASYQAQYTNMSASQIESLYLGWLQAEGRFYNSSLTGTQFCGTQATRQFHLGSANWGGLFVNASGSIYLNNGTGPVNGNGTALPTQKFGNVSTWSVSKSQLYLMPELGSVSIPVGKVWEIPINNPVQVYAITTGQFLTLYGNGTCVDTTQLACVMVNQGTSGPARQTNSSYAQCSSKVTGICSAVPGAAIYLTSCVVGGSAASNCAVTVSTINATMANVTCGAACNPHTPPPASGGFSFGNPLSGLTNWLAGLFGGGPFAQALAGLATIVGVLLIIAGSVYLVFVYLDRKAKGAT